VVGGADFASDSTCFFFECANREIRAVRPINQILPDPLFQPAAPFALGDMHQLVQEQFAIAPGIGSNDDGMTDRDGAARVRYDLRSARCFSQLRVFRQRHSIDGQNSDTTDIFYADLVSVGDLAPRKRASVLENEIFNISRPLKSERQKLFECFLIEHGTGTLTCEEKQKPCKRTEIRMSKLATDRGFSRACKARSAK
jgi:hypothetical protein